MPKPGRYKGSKGRLFAGKASGGRGAGMGAMTISPGVADSLRAEVEATRAARDRSILGDRTKSEKMWERRGKRAPRVLLRRRAETVTNTPRAALEDRVREVVRAEFTPRYDALRASVAEEVQRRVGRVEAINKRRASQGRPPLGGHPGDRPGHPFRGNQYS